LTKLITITQPYLVQVDRYGTYIMMMEHPGGKQCLELPRFLSKEFGLN